MARRGPVRGPSHPCKGCNERYRRHGSVASVQLARRLQEAILLIIRRSWVRAPPAPHTLTCGNVRFGPAGQRAYRIDAGMVAAMTLAERFAEHGKRRQKPWLAKLEPVRPGPVAALQPDQASRPEAAAVRPPRSRWTRPPSSSRNSSAGASVNSSPPWGGPHGRRQASRNGPASANPPPAPHHKPCGSPAGTGHNLTNGVAFSHLPAADSPRMVPSWPNCQK
jgi:hypothetical protein